MTVQTRAALMLAARNDGWRESSLLGYAFIRDADDGHRGLALGIGPDTWSLAEATDKPGVYKVVAEGLTVFELQAAVFKVDNEKHAS